ncbi:MAG: hypothetical protein LAT76_02945 [Schleiferiaceae bacterium]|nr:hypothetical protein [Schleiferiaceae bacterium]
MTIIFFKVLYLRVFCIIKSALQAIAADTPQEKTAALPGLAGATQEATESPTAARFFRRGVAAESASRAA